MTVPDGLQDRILEAVASVKAGDDDKATAKKLTDALVGTGTTGYVGVPDFAGRVGETDYAVQFYGYSSRWPQWAYEPARDAILSGHKLWVIANGLPWGFNLLQVHLLRQ